MHLTKDIRKKHTLIVGGSRGIGLEILKVFAEKNQFLSVIGRTKPAGYTPNNSDYHFLSVDVLKATAVIKVLDKAIDQCGPINNIVFCQRYRGEGNDWEGEIDLSLTATKNIIEYLADKFDEESCNSIVLLSSVASTMIASEQPLSYHVAKAGIDQMVRYYAVTLGSSNIRVNSVSPGTVLKEESKDFYLKNEAILNLYKNITPLGRMGTSKDIAETIFFLCSPKASFITGQNIIVDGGLSLNLQASLALKIATPER